MHLVHFSLDRTYTVLSSALYPDGVANVDRIVLALVNEDYDSLTPLEDVMSVCDCSRSLVFMTAARKYCMRDFGGDFLLFMSAGIGRSGEHAGGRTVNIAVMLRMRARLNAMVDMVRTVTEAKCSYLMRFGLTGTASDATAVGVSEGREETFLGPSTEVGMAVARAVIGLLDELLSHELSGRKSP